MRARLSDIAQFLSGSIDETLLARWIRRAALFDWSNPPGSIHRAINPAQTMLPEVDGALALYALMRPLFEPSNVRGPDGRPLVEPHARRAPAIARIAALLENARLDRAVEETIVRYRMSDRAPAAFNVPHHTDCPLRLLAALSIPVMGQFGHIAARWLRPEALVQER
jgi:CRISPR-associated protein Csx17